MRLFSSPPSPFGRKVKMTAAITGLIDAIEIVQIDANDPQSLALNPSPIQKIPLLELDDGHIITDSKVICEYLIARSGRHEMLPDADRIGCLTRASVADGITEAALLMVYERRFRPESQINHDWLNRQNLKVLGGLDWITTHIRSVDRTPTLDQVTLAASLGYLDFRFAGEWRTRYRELALWLTQYQQMVPSYQETSPDAHA